MTQVIVLRRLADPCALGAWADRAGFRDGLPANWHVTIAKATRSAVLDAFPRVDRPLTVPASTDRLVGRMGGIIALMFRSPAIEQRHRQISIAGAEWEHHNFRCHVTFAVDDGRDLYDLRPFSGRLIFSAEEWLVR